MRMLRAMALVAFGIVTFGSVANVLLGAKTAAVLMAYCAKYGVHGGFVCYDEGQDEILINEGPFSENRNDPNWKTVEDVLNAPRRS